MDLKNVWGFYKRWINAPQVNELWGCFNTDFW